MVTEKTSSPALHTRSRKRLRYIFRLILAFIVVLLTIAGVAATVIIRTAYPQTSGIIHLAGTHGKIAITRDTYGVPHIVAENTADAFFAQGYVTAQDRLWQMEFNRRIASGRLSEILGSSLLNSDKFLRTLGLNQSAEADFASLKPTLRTQLESYAAGVNAFIDSHKDSLPLEFRILGFTPELWRTTDSIAYGKVVALSLDTTWYSKLARMDALAAVGPEAMKLLFPAYPQDNPTLIDGSGNTAIPLNTSEQSLPPSATPDAFTLTPAQQASVGHMPIDVLQDTLGLRGMLGNLGNSLGSNDWVIGGKHTTTGKPIVANDPHLGIDYPSIWYEIAMRSGTLNEIGFSFPGVPGIILGHNDHVAWGVTNGEVDDTDLYIEKLSDDGITYLYDGKQLPVMTRAETIKVKDEKDVTFVVRSTNHGPIINDATSLLRNKKDIAPISLEWTALQPAYNFVGFLELGMAQNLDQLQAALGEISITQNFVFADTTGNIGYHMSGWLPIRSRANGWLPVDGTTSANDWHGQIPFDKLPHLLNPSTGIIWTANNRIVTDDYPYYLTSDWDVGFRARRIEQLLSAKEMFTLDDVAAIQNDVHSIPAKEITPYFVKAAQNSHSNGTQTAMRLFTNWDANISRTSVAATFYEVTMSQMIQDVVKGTMGSEHFATWQNNQTSVGQILFLRNQLITPLPPFLANAAARDATIVKAENEAYAYLSKFFGTTDTSKWQWGQLHQAHFDHPLSEVSVLKLIFPNQTVARPGDSSTVNVGGTGNFALNDYTQYSVSSMRDIMDLSNLDNSRFVMTTGESGLPFAPHNFDLLPLWDAGQYQPMDFSTKAVSDHIESTLISIP